MGKMSIKKDIVTGLKTSPIKIKSSALYGSLARGVQTPNSDIDLLIIADEINPKRHRRRKEIVCIKETLPGGLPFDILLLTSQECIANFRNHNPLFLDIADEGIILIDKDGFLKRQMEETMAYIGDKKIEKHPDGWSFPVLHRKPTYLSKISNKDFAIAMFNDGKRDFVIAKNIMKGGYYDKAVYHLQQAVEKAVKAELI